MSSDERLEDVDPEYARLFSALRRAEPKRSAVEKTLAAVANELPPTSRGTDVVRSVRAPRVWVGVGVAGLALSLAGYEWQRDASAPVDVAAMTTPALAPSVARADDAPVAEPLSSSVKVEDLPPAPVEAAKPSAPVPPSGAAQPSARGASPAQSGGAFLDDLALVERIRTQLSRGETDACLRSIDEYYARHRDGAFTQEVDVMRIEALATSGKRDAARAAGGRFLSQYPTSPYVDRVRSVLADSQ